MADAVKATTKKPRRIKYRWIALLALIVGVLIAAKAGLVSYGWAALMSRTLPSDRSLLAYVPEEVPAFAIVDPHQIKPAALGPPGGPLRAALEARLDDVEKAIGIDLGYDIDKLVLSPSLVVARGRFDGARLADRLAEHRYVKAEHQGMLYLVRKDEDAIAVIDDEVLLYGDEPSLKSAIDVKLGTGSLRSSDVAMARLDQVGWDHALLVAVRVKDDKPSLRDMMSGGSGPRAVTVGIGTRDGADVKVVVEAASPSAAEDLKKWIEERRGDPAGYERLVGPELAPQLAEIAKAASLSVPAGSSTLVLEGHVPLATLDAAAPALGKADKPLFDRVKTYRVWQLLAGG